jgi:hypothetical protein
VAVAVSIAASAQAEERQDGHHDDDQTHQVDDCIHVKILRVKKRRLINGTFLPGLRPRPARRATSRRAGRLSATTAQPDGSVQLGSGQPKD